MKKKQHKLGIISEKQMNQIPDNMRIIEHGNEYRVQILCNTGMLWWKYQEWETYWTRGAIFQTDNFVEAFLEIMKLAKIAPYVRDKSEWSDYDVVTEVPE